MGTAFNELACRSARHVAARLRRVPRPYRERGQIGYDTGTRIVGLVREDLRPSDILTRMRSKCDCRISAIGGSTNCASRCNALARHIGV